MIKLKLFFGGTLGIVIMLSIFLSNTALAKRSGCQKGGNCINGIGDFYYRDKVRSGDRYAGGFVNGKRHGSGTYYWWHDKRGQEMTATWQNGIPIGAVVVSYPGGDKYVGSWKMRSGRNGIGKWILADDSYWIAQWSDNQMKGYAIKYDFEGGILRESFIHGDDPVQEPTFVNASVFNAPYQPNSGKNSTATSQKRSFSWFEDSTSETADRLPKAGAENSVGIDQIRALEATEAPGANQRKGVSGFIIDALEAYEPPSFEDRLQDRALDELF